MDGLMLRQTALSPDLTSPANQATCLSQSQHKEPEFGVHLQCEPVHVSTSVTDQEWENPRDWVRTVLPHRTLASDGCFMRTCGWSDSEAA